jgi:putative serine protease PepD
MPGSPAEAAGVRPGDVLVALDGAPLADVRGYSAALKSHQAGDTVELTVRRDGEEMTLTATLAER